MKLRECAINAGRRAGVAVRDMTVDNPVLVRDVRTRMRGGKPFMLVGAYAALLTVAALIAYANAPFEDISRGSSSSPVGSILFATIVILQAVLLTIITPGLTAAAIASEKEKRTFELLALTPVTARQVAAGKLIPVLLFVLMLMLVSVPLAMLCVVLGGFSPGNVASVYLYVFGGISIIAAFGLLMSSVYANSSGAVISTYIAAFIGGGMSISALSSYMISATMGHGGWWLGRTLSVSFLSILCGAAIVVGLTDAAASRITNRRTPSAVLTRIPLLILAVIAVGSVLWNMSPPASPDVGDIAVPLLGIIMGFMTVCGWFFCTADKAPTNRNPLAIRKILRRELSGALPWVMLMTALLVLPDPPHAIGGIDQHSACGADGPNRNRRGDAAGVHVCSKKGAGGDGGFPVLAYPLAGIPHPPGRRIFDEQTYGAGLGVPDRVFLAFAAVLGPPQCRGRPNKAVGCAPEPTGGVHGDSLPRHNRFGASRLRLCQADAQD